MCKIDYKDVIYQFLAPRMLEISKVSMEESIISVYLLMFN